MSITPAIVSPQNAHRDKVAALRQQARKAAIPHPLPLVADFVITPLPHPSFLILSRERFQACQPYFSQWLPIQRQEELPNGAVFLFFGYPIQFEALQGSELSLKAEGKGEGGEKGMFVTVPLYPDEDLEAAYQRITQAFEEAGTEVYHPQMLHDIAPITDFARLFLVFTEEEAHTFFICPYAWTPERVEKMLVMVELMREMEGRKCFLVSPSMSSISSLLTPCRKNWKRQARATELVGRLGDDRLDGKEGHRR